MIHLIWTIEYVEPIEPGYTRLIGALDDTHKYHQIVKFVPFSGELVDAQTKTLISNNILRIPLGSTWLLHEAVKRKWYGVYYNCNFDQRVWSHQWKAYTFNPDVTFHTLDAVQPPTDDPFFIRPCSAINTFGGCLLTAPFFNTWREQAYGFRNGFEVVGPDTMVSIAAQKKILAEYRVYVTNWRVCTASQYKLDGQVKHKNADDDRELLNFAQNVVNSWSPHKNFVLDVFRDEQGILKVGEVNCLNCSGFYESDMSRIVYALK